MSEELHHISDFASLADEITKIKGLETLNSQKIVSASIDPRKREAVFKIREPQRIYHTVVVKDYLSPAISSSCTCHTSNKLCEHQVAALLYLKKNYQKLLDKYNSSYYPQLPSAPDTRYLEKIRDFPVKNNAQNILRAGLQWINPLLQNATVNVDNHTVRFKHIFDNIIESTCTCGKRNCEHRAKAADFLLSYLKTKAYSNILKAYLRKEAKPLLIGKTDEITFATLKASLPFYLPENHELLDIKTNFIKLKIKVRYKPVVLWFSTNNDKIFSRCYCNDNVKGICKHQIAALHMLTELDRHFFEHLTQKDKIEDLKNIFI